eukprot:766535-Hanusia_phi.AAC.3
MGWSDVHSAALQASEGRGTVVLGWHCPARTDRGVGWSEEAFGSSESCLTSALRLTNPPPSTQTLGPGPRRRGAALPGRVTDVTYLLNGTCSARPQSRG